MSEQLYLLDTNVLLLPVRGGAMGLRAPVSGSARAAE